MLLLQGLVMHASPDYAELFARRLRGARESLGWTRERLEKASGVGDRSIAAYENRETTPPIDKAARLAIALGLRLDVMLENPHRETAPPPQEITLLIDGTPWSVHPERRAAARAEWEVALEAARDFRATLPPPEVQPDRRQSAG